MPRQTTTRIISLSASAIILTDVPASYEAGSSVPPGGRQHFLYQQSALHLLFLTGMWLCYEKAGIGS